MLLQTSDDNVFGSVNAFGSGGGAGCFVAACGAFGGGGGCDRPVVPLATTACGAFGGSGGDGAQGSDCHC